MRRRWLLLVAAVPLLLAGADWLAWNWLAHRLRDAYGAWTRDAWAHGWVANADRQEIGGFPFAATLTLHGFTLRGGVAAVPAGIGWEAEQVTLALSLAQPTRLQIEPQGRQTLRLSGMAPIAFTADAIDASVPLGRVKAGAHETMTLTASELSGGLARSAHPRDVRIAHLALDLAAARDPVRGTDAALHLEGKGVDLPDTGRWPLGATVTSLAADLSLTSPPLPAGRPEEAASAWRDGHGRMLLQALSLRWGPLGLRGNFWLGLDGALQPEGSGTAEVEGADATLDALAAAGALQPGLATTAKAVLLLMARPAPDGRGVELPVSLKHNTLSVGKIPLVQLRRVAWGGS